MTGALLVLAILYILGRRLAQYIYAEVKEAYNILVRDLF